MRDRNRKYPYLPLRVERNLPSFREQPIQFPEVLSQQLFALDISHEFFRLLELHLLSDCLQLLNDVVLRKELPETSNEQAIAGYMALPVPSMPLDVHQVVLQE